MRNSLKKQKTISTTPGEISISSHFMFKNVDKLSLESLKIILKKL